MDTPRRSRLLLIGLTVVLVATATVYFRSLDNDFIQWDDGLLIYNNTVIKQISPLSVRRIFTSYDPELYIPLTLFAYQVQHAIGGLNPTVYHTTSLLLHLLNTTLVGWFALLLLRKPWPALIAAALFALHPIQVEAVSWASGLKDVLSTAFALGTLIMYITYIRHPSFVRYGGALLLFLCALLSKPSVITLPLALPLLELWQGKTKDPKRIFAYTAPFLTLSMGFGIIAYFGKTTEMESALWLPGTLLLPGYTVLFAVGKLLWPVGLSLVYPFDGTLSAMNPVLILPLSLLVIALCFLLYRLKKGVSVVSFGLAFALLTLAPSLLNAVKVGQAYVFSDRYVYLSSVGLVLVIAEGIAELQRRRGIIPVLRWALAAFGLALLLLLSIGSFQRSLAWKNTSTLLTPVIESRPQYAMPHLTIGIWYMRQGKLDAARREFHRAIELDPAFSSPHMNLAYLALFTGKQGEARREYDAALAINPDDADARFQLGQLYERQGKLDAAFAEYERVLVKHPRHLETLNNLGGLYAKRREFDREAEQYERALAIDPFYAPAVYNMAAAEVDRGNFAEAERLYRRAADLDDDMIFQAAAISLAKMYVKQDRSTEALRWLQAVLLRNPRDEEALTLLREILPNSAAPAR